MTNHPLLVFAILLSGLFFFDEASVANTIARPSLQPLEVPDNHILSGRWDAYWIMHPAASTTEYGVFHFRKVINLDEVPESFIIHLSADTRYRLFVNGGPASKGPAVGDRLNWRFETVDIASHLRSGENVIAAKVWNFGQYNALQHHSYRTAFVLQGNSDTESELNTGSEWKVYHNEGYRPIPVQRNMVLGFYAAPHGEFLDIAMYPHGWLEAAYDDAHWMQAANYRRADPRGTEPHGSLYGWNLVPRNIPPMAEYKQRILRLRRSTSIKPGHGFPAEAQPVIIPPHTREVMLLDQTYLTNAYPVLHISGGKSAKILLRYAEALRYPDHSKGHRNRIEGKELIGFHDTFISDGKPDRVLQTLWLRSFRYLQLEIETADEPLIIEDLYGLATHYPFEENARFSSNDPRLSDIWQAGWRTALLNAFESYWDCAYYEQLQYVGDTRIQALISLYVSGDDRLMRNAIEHFNHSRMPDGLTMSRYPSSHPQYIPPYSLLWITMVHDYWMHRDDDRFVEQYLPGIRGVLDWFEAHLDAATGLTGPLPWWNYVDLTEGFPRGIPPCAGEGGSIVISLQWLYALEYSLELAREFGRHADAAVFHKRIEDLRKAIIRHGWNQELQLFADTPQHDKFSQHANIFAILTDLIPAEEQQSLLKRILDNDNLVQTTLYSRFYLFRAMRHAGMGDQYLNYLGPWHDALEIGLTTFPENPEPTRSDAHAWSASPNYDFLATVAGILPASPRFESVLIAPNPGYLDIIDASMPHPMGQIEVYLTFENSELSGTVSLPQGLKGKLIWQDVEISLSAGEQTVTAGRRTNR